MNKGKLAGVGNDFGHQIIIAYIIHALIEKFKKGTYKNYIPLPELPLEDLKYIKDIKVIKEIDKRVPDITIWKTIRGQLDSQVVIIEICAPKQINKEAKKITDIMKKNFSIKESFIIDKENLTVKRIQRINNNILLPEDYSRIDLLKFDLLKLLRSIPAYKF